MESSSSRAVITQAKDDDILRQIAALQAQLTNPSIVKTVREATPPPVRASTPEPTGRLLAPATPSPKKKRREAAAVVVAAKNAPKRPVTEFIHVKPAPSTLVAKLSGLHTQKDNDASVAVLARSSAFTERPITPPPPEDHQQHGLKRDENLALVEDIEIGPYYHKPPLDDPEFKRLEPHSGIALSSRTVPHDDIDEYMRGRYYLSPSRLYSAVRMLPGKQGYDVPVEGDWVTIAVVAERGPVKFSRAPVGLGKDDDANVGAKPDKNKKPEYKPGGKKYVNIKLIDFGARGRSASSATGGQAIIRGDAFLTLLLFESDGHDQVKAPDGTKGPKVYKGGSRGAFEAMAKLKEGDVVAMLNPKVLKPFQRSGDTPHPVNNILAVTPESVSSLIVLGRARDLGMCPVVKRDGKPCGSWCDKRVSEVSDYHIQKAVEGKRAGRPEFSIGTSGYTGPVKKKSEYDPGKKWGLKPNNDGGDNATYVVSGHIVNNGGGSSLHNTDAIGREGQAKAQRAANKSADKTLKALLERDKEGMRAVLKAREVMKEEKGKGKKDPKGKVKAREVETTTKKRKRKAGEETEGSSASDTEEPKKASSYSAHVIKHLGFDPAVKAGYKRGEDDTVQGKLDELAALQSSRGAPALGPRPGERIRSGVSTPAAKLGITSGPSAISAPRRELAALSDDEEMVDFSAVPPRSRSMSPEVPFKSTRTRKKPKTTRAAKAKAKPKPKPKATPSVAERDPAPAPEPEPQAPADEVMIDLDDF